MSPADSRSGCLQSIRSRAGTKALCGLPPARPGWGGVPAPELGQTSPHDRRVMPSRPAAPALRYSPGGGGGLVLPTLPGNPPGHPDTVLIQEKGETLLFPQMFHNTQSPWDSLLLPIQGALGAPRFVISALPVLGSRDRLPWDETPASLGSVLGRRQLDSEAVCAQLDRTVHLGWGSSQACGPLS